MSSPAVVDLCTQLRLFLEPSPDALCLEEILSRVDVFVLECSAAPAPESSTLLSQLEDGLQQIYDEVLGHSLLPHAEVFLAFLHRLKPILSSRSVISTWFDLVLRPVLREPKLSPQAVGHAKQLILIALDPDSNFSNADSDPVDIEKQRERMGDFRRRLMDLYLLDAFNESSGDDVLEWAGLEQSQREQKACWKANLEDVLVSMGVERPQVSSRKLSLSPLTYPWPLGFLHRAVPLLYIANISTAAAHTFQCIHFQTGIPRPCACSCPAPSYVQPFIFSHIRRLLNYLHYWTDCPQQASSHFCD